MSLKAKPLKALLCIAVSAAVAGTAVTVKSYVENIPVKFRVDTQSTVQDDYIGVGGNFWSGCMTAEGKEYLNMSQPYVDLNIKRIMTVKPAFMRMLVMPHYMVDFDDNHDGVIDDRDTDKGEQNWKNGIYDFDTDYMNNFFTYAEAFKEAGTEIELNFGLACSDAIKDWYAIKGTIDTDGGNRSAPDDLEAFAKACSALLSECYRRGLDNVKYVGFYNEVAHVEYGAFGDKRIYWCKMLEKVHNRLKSDGIRDKVNILGSDCDTQFKYRSGDPEHDDFLDYVKEHASEYYDMISIHLYWAWDYNSSAQLRTVDEMQEYCENIVSAHPKTLVTEFTYGTNNNYSVSRAGQVLAHSNSGILCSGFWFFCGTYIPDPLNTYRKDPHELWDSPAKEGVGAVNTTFGEMGLLMRYIPKHSSVLKSESGSKDMRIAVYNKGDDYTAVIETNKASAERNIEIDFGKAIGKKLKKYVYDFPDDINNSQFDANAVLPVSEKELSLTDGKLTDKVGAGHSLIIYSTMDEEKQLVLNTVEQSVSVGQTAQFNITKKIALGAGEKIKWEIISGGGQIDDNGKYTASGVNPGDVVSVKASAAGTYTVGIVKIK